MQSDIYKHVRVYYLALVVSLGMFLTGYNISFTGSLAVWELYYPSNETAYASIKMFPKFATAFYTGGLIGSLVSAPFSAKYGKKHMIMVFNVIFCAGVIFQLHGGTDRIGTKYMQIGRYISGFGAGAFSAVIPAYVAECGPKEVRGRLTGLLPVALYLGDIIAPQWNHYLKTHSITHHISWSTLCGMQLVPAIILAIGLSTLPESPRYLVRAGKLGDAMECLAYLRHTTTDHPVVRSEFAEIGATVIEEDEAKGGLSWIWMFFGKGHFVRFAIGVSIFAIQQLSAQVLVVRWVSEVIDLAPRSTNSRYMALKLYYALKVIVTLSAVLFRAEKSGRRQSLMKSAMSTSILFYVLSIFAQHQPNLHAPLSIGSLYGMLLAVLLYFCCLAYSYGWGPFPWIYVSEIFPNRTRHYGLSISTSIIWLRLLNGTKVGKVAWNSGFNYKVFFYLGIANIAVSAVYAYFLPETTGKSLEEMDVLFGTIQPEDRERNILIASKSIPTEKTDLGMVESEKDFVAHSAAIKQVLHRNAQPCPLCFMNLAWSGANEVG
ncbi:hypothetical protein FRC02_003131 [Tulasnella sp. 418]|nr:hypothetical protein FRC02_003131 [Tulasnella sp. 418]